MDIIMQFTVATTSVWGCTTQLIGIIRYSVMGYCMINNFVYIFFFNGLLT